MSIVLAASIGLGQLCYDAQKDINADDFVKEANYYSAPLKAAREDKASICLPIKSEKQLAEAKKMVLIDSTKETLTIIAD